LAGARLHRVLNGTFEEVESQLPQRYFDIIICNDVIEHMDDHDRFLRRVRAYLRDGGVLVGSIPNVRFYNNVFEFLVLRDWHYQDAGILDRTHLRFFTERSLRRSLQEAGYTIEILHGISDCLKFGWSKHAFTSFVMAYAAIFFSLGRFRDIRYLQFAFRARVTK
jgi:2-polyprenyl-3-methyl-5-hydroxy-6-metoxy-1,4-benzoquinol methylase